MVPQDTSNCLGTDEENVPPQDHIECLQWAITGAKEPIIQRPREAALRLEKRDVVLRPLRICHKHQIYTIESQIMTNPMDQSTLVP